MADAMVVNVPPYDGAYEFDLANSPLTTLEWRWVKKISGYLPLTAMEGFKGGDPDLYLSWAIVAMVRAGKIEEDDVMSVADLLARSPFDGVAITFRGDTEAEVEDDVDPLASGSPPSSGDASTESSEPSPENGSQPVTGRRGLAITSDSVQETLQA